MNIFSSSCQKKQPLEQSPFLPLEKKTKIFNPLKAPKVLLISGPTATGKTALSLLLAEMLKGEIVSCDSMQVYRGMDIGTAKVSDEEQHRIAHHLIDIREIYETFNVVDFYHEANQCVEAILARDKVPILVGGTGFYLRAFLYGPPNGPPSLPHVRSSLEKALEEKGAEVLYQELLQKDPKYAATITANDHHKIIRALEIISLSGRCVSDFEWKCTKPRSEYRFHGWFLHRPREHLYQMINARCDQMLDLGFVDEVKELEKKGLRKNSNVSQAIGYRQCLDYLDSDQRAEQYKIFVEKFKQACRHYAKRQFTWFRKESLFQWMDMDAHDLEITAEIIAKEFQSRI